MLEQAFELYFNQKLSLRIVADKLQTYPNKVRRLLQEGGFKLRDKAASQATALEVGRSKHPTEGKHHSKKTKKKIAEKAAAMWQNRPDSEKAVLASKSRDRWHNKTPSQQAEFAKKAAAGVRKAGLFGSKIEQFILAKLREYDFDPQYQRENLIFSERMRVDIFIPGSMIVVEVDGPSHFEPIWGEEALQRKIAADDKKNGLLLYCGYHVIRLRCRRKTLTNNYKELVWSKLYWEIQRLVDINKPELVIVECREE